MGYGKTYKHLSLMSFCLKIMGENMPTVNLNENNYKRLINLAGKIQVKKSVNVSVNDVITGMLNLTEKAILEECLKV